MKAKLIVEGKEFDIEINDPELQKLIKPEKKTGYEPSKYHWSYFYVNDDGEAKVCIETNELKNQNHYNEANYYSDKTIAENNARADRLMRQLRRFAVFHRNESLDWNNTNDVSCKYYIFYDYADRRLGVDDVSWNRDLFNVYFDSKADADAAVELLHDELIWYFTEYKDSL